MPFINSAQSGFVGRPAAIQRLLMVSTLSSFTLQQTEQNRTLRCHKHGKNAITLMTTRMPQVQRQHRGTDSTSEQQPCAQTASHSLSMDAIL